MKEMSSLTPRSWLQEVAVRSVYLLRTTAISSLTSTDILQWTTAARKVRQDHKDPPGHKDRPGSRGRKGGRDQTAFRERQVRPAQLAHKECRDLQDPQEQTDPPDHRAHKAPRASEAALPLATARLVR
jgi:hypothetical protein